MEIIEWTSKRGKKYVTFIEKVDGIKFTKQPKKCNLCIDTKTAYATTLEFNTMVREWAREHGLGEIEILLQKLSYKLSK